MADHVRKNSLFNNIKVHKGCKPRLAERAGMGF